MNYEDNITQIKGIGDKTARLFNKLGIFTVGELIEYYPREYDVYERIMPIADVNEGRTVTIEGYINNSPKIVNTKNIKIISVMLRDETGSIHLNWYNMLFLKSKLKIGSSFIVRGKVVSKRGLLSIDQPEMITREEYFRSLNSMKPIYPLTKGLSNKVVIKAVEYALAGTDAGRDFLSVTMRKKYNLVERGKAIRRIHFPQSREEMLTARKRIVFDEFFVFALTLRALKQNNVNAVNNFVMENSADVNEFIKNLGYELTGAQLRTWEDIKRDLSGSSCMNRLVQGDVGSGKTVISQLALFLTARNGYQGLLMAPTEVLANQHYQSFCDLFEGYGIRVGLLTGSMTAKAKRETYQKIKNHELDIIIGTHALIQEKAEYDNVALVVTDEQHRFGVRQREALAAKGNNPHMLVMSATPIPRTLALIMYGDLDISVIDEMPKGRRHIRNCVVNTNYRHTAYEFIKKEIEQGRQAYVICPLVEANEETDAENVIDYAEKLRQIFPAECSVEYLHGAMKPKEKNRIMSSFAGGDIKILVSTTVVEVGVNVPNATVMLIENADRFGLAQLHQLRGRVGRGKYQSYCIMINTNESQNVSERLEILNKSDDGFYIAEEDLRLRGPGELFGTMQSGELVFKLGDVFNDSKTLLLANEACLGLTDEEFSDLWSQKLHILLKEIHL